MYTRACVLMEAIGNFRGHPLELFTVFIWTESLTDKELAN